MASYVSPGVYFVESDFSQYAPSINSSVAAVVGFASRGPENKATLITRASDLVNLFGRPDQTTMGENGIYGAMEILRKTNQLYFVRCVDSNQADASSYAAFGSCPAFFLNASGFDGARLASTNLTLRVESVKDGQGVAQVTDQDITWNTGVDGAACITNLKSAIDNVTNTQSAFTVFQPSATTYGVAAASGLWIVGSYSGSAASLELGVVASGTSWASTAGLYSEHGEAVAGFGMYYPETPTSGKGVLGLAAFGASATSGTNYGTQFESDLLVGGPTYCLESLYPGAGYNASTLTGGSVVGVKVNVSSLAGANQYIHIEDNGAVTETFLVNNLAGDLGAYNYENVINTGETELTSNTVKGNIQSEALWTDIHEFYVSPFSGLTAVGSSSINGTTALDMELGRPRFVKLVDGTYSMTGGNSGDGTGNVADAFLPTGGATSGHGIYALDDDALNISMACMPGVSNQAVQNAFVSLAETSQNFIAVINTPEGLTPQQAVTWHNGGGEGRSASINSSYAAIYYPWLQIYSPYHKTTKYVSPDVYGIAQMCYNDAVAEPWFAPAGVVRGRLSKPLDTQFVLNSGDRNTLYSGGNTINPIAKFAQDGIVVYGQRTTQRTPSALDRINIRRMMIQIRKMTLAATRSFVFEPNDALTWQRIRETLTPMFSDIARRRGITEFKVVCDSSTNTPIRIERNELWCQVIIKPTKTAEMLVFEVNLTSQSAAV